MGCIASTAICRSISIREELSHGFQSSASEVVRSSKGSNDQVFALFCSSKLRNSSFKLPPTDTSSGLLPGFDEVADEESSGPDGGDGEAASLRRSKSCQLPREKEILEVNENKLDRNEKKRLGSRSFHTVEEFDALLHRMKDAAAEANCVEETSNNTLGIREHENGWKRKAVGKGLKSLDVPSIEFPAVARFKGGNGFVCPASYATPKFGSYNVGPTMQEEEEAESRVFSPELVAAFEDCMQQLQLEQDTILMEMEMDGYSWVDDEMEKVVHNLV